MSPPVAGVRRETGPGRAAPRGQGPRIGFFGLFGSGNFGNDGSLKAMIALVGRACPNARLICFCDGPERVRQTFEIAAVAIVPRYLSPTSRIGRWLLAIPGKTLVFLRALVHTRMLDTLIVPGTGILDDFGCGPLAMPADAYIWCLAAWLTRTPIWFTSIGAGPIVHPLSRRLMVGAAKMAQYRSYRDADAKRFLTNAGVATGNDPVFPDLAFDLPRPRLLRERASGDPLTVGIGVMAYHGWKSSSESGAIHTTYKVKLCRFCMWLIEKGYRVRLLGGDDLDNAAIGAFEQALAAALPEASLARNILAEPVHDLDDVMTQMAETDVVVATRFHNIVCALKMGKPTLSLGYAEKNAILLEEAGLGGFTQGVEDFDLELLKDQFQRLVADSATFERSIGAFNALAAKRLKYQERLLGSRLGADQPSAVQAHVAHPQPLPPRSFRLGSGLVTAPSTTAGMRQRSP
jgi:polysaccharide pyruvyl transferase WcaK-like protein